MILAGQTETLQIPKLAIRTAGTSFAWQYATQAPIEGVEKRQFVGRNGQPFNLSLYLHAEFIDPTATWNALWRMGESHEVLTLQEDDGTLLGDFVIEALDENTLMKLPDGFVVARTVTVKLAEPGLDADAATAVAVANAGAVEGTKMPTTTTPKAEDTTGDPAAVSARDIARLS
jgi:phage protein U